jgi:hypothetical protein
MPWRPTKQPTINEDAELRRLRGLSSGEPQHASLAASCGLPAREMQRIEESLEVAGWWRNFDEVRYVNRCLQWGARLDHGD